MNTVYLSLGSNLGDRASNLDRAVAELRGAGVEVQRVSSLYETEPVGRRAQPWFLNLVAEAETELFPVQLLGRLQTIEIRLGRRRDVVQGPRTIDIDILFYGNFRIRSERLVVPHPRLEQRRFVLEPLAELAPELRHPVSRLTIRELLASTADRSAVRRAPPANLT
ncbi:MAG: 2-amino-4-hydroxy-6-hydroxymethyldihydropteridine diphosphokinase [Acidobacteria bacterium]|nr:2-amino-4-hydroxy-6-hydroxymethyldihydropteridine diphosphokinase [Acidobacteriota bacterium]